ncbi:MAG: glycosyltransferase family 2 protein [Cyanobacteria bacterium P01_H01_bin.21]
MESVLDNEVMERQSDTLPLVSVLINNYNYGKFLKQAVDSCLNQTYENVEVIVVDDGSTDDSKEIIESFGDQVIPILKKNGGQASALNAGFQASSGDIICLLDADDLYLPERIAEVVKLFQSHPSVDWVFTESSAIESERIFEENHDDLFGEIRSSNSDSKIQEIDFTKELKDGQIPNFTPSTSNLCFSRKILEKLFPLPAIKGISGMAITDLYIKLLAVGLGSGYVNKNNIGIYRFHNNYYKFQNLDKKRRLFGEIYTTTGYSIRQKFPEFKKISNKILSKGFSTYLSSNYSKNEQADADCNLMFKEHIGSCSLQEKMKILASVLYYRFKLYKKDFV